MLTHYDTIFLSPHLDDVALSCGGQVFQLTQAAKSVLIVTITAGDPPVDNLPPFAQAHHVAWDLKQDAVAERRAEDIAACKLLGADWLHLDVQDAIYRLDPETGAALYNNDVQLFGAVNSAENNLIQQIAAQFHTLPSADTIVCPLTVGNHVDHQFTRHAAEAAFGKRLAFYEDYPYVHWHGLGDKVDGAWTPDVVPISAEALAAKITAVAAYVSQVDHLFDSAEAMHNMLTSYANQIGGERIWHRQ